jgi:hypothetical protein
MREQTRERPRRPCQRRAEAATARGIKMLKRTDKGKRHLRSMPEERQQSARPRLGHNGLTRAITDAAD